MCIRDRTNIEEIVSLAAATSEPELAADIRANHDIIRDPNADETAKGTAWHYLGGQIARIGLVIIGIPPAVLSLASQEFMKLISKEAVQWLWNLFKDRLGGE